LLTGLSGNGRSGFSREGWNPKTNVRGFVLILLEIVVGRPAKDRTNIPTDGPMFVYEMIQSGLLGEWRRQFSFQDIFEQPRS
jgi:hypothetical protein